MNRYLLGLAGIVVILGFAFLLSSNRRAIRLRVVAAAFALQAGIAVLVLYTDWGRAGIASLSRGVANLLGYAGEGTTFLFAGLFPQTVCLAFANKTLASAVAGALNDMKKDGAYDKLFDQYGVLKHDEPSFAIKGPGPA